MRDGGLDQAIRAAGGIGALARTLGISQPSVSNWQKVPAERVVAVEAITGVARAALRPDLYPSDGAKAVDEIDLLRSHEYALLSSLLARAPDRVTLARVAGLKGDATPLGLAHLGLAEAASGADPQAVQNEYFDLFVGLGRGELLPYASYYLTGFLHERPLAKVREDFLRLGIERTEGVHEPEDGMAMLCEVMAGLAAGRIEAEPGADRQFFARHVEPWAARFFADLETARSAKFYRSVGAVGRLFVEVEAQAFAMAA